MLGVVALAARPLVRDAVLENFLIFRSERRALRKPIALGLIERGRTRNPADDEPCPLAFQIRVLRLIERLRATDCGKQRYDLGNHPDQCWARHDLPPGGSRAERGNDKPGWVLRKRVGGAR